MGNRIKYIAMGVSGPLATWFLYGEWGAILLVLPLSLLALAAAWCCCRVFHMQKKAVFFAVLSAEIVSLFLLMLIYPFADPEAAMWLPAAMLFFVPYSLVTIVTVSAATYLWKKETFAKKQGGKELYFPVL